MLCRISRFKYAICLASSSSFGRKLEPHAQTYKQTSSASVSGYTLAYDNAACKKRYLNVLLTALNMVTPQTVFLGTWPGNHPPPAPGPGPRNSFRASKQRNDSVLYGYPRLRPRMSAGLVKADVDHSIRHTQHMTETAWPGNTTTILFQRKQRRCIVLLHL